VIMPFGKYKGRPLADVSSDYLAWVLAKCRNADPALLRAVRAELNRRDHPATARRKAYQEMREREPLDSLDAEQLEIEMIRLVLHAEQSGDFGRGPVLDRLWEGLALTFNMLLRGTSRGPRPVRELIQLARRMESN